MADGLLSDDDVFGSAPAAASAPAAQSDAPRLLSDDDVFGEAAKPPVTKDVEQGLAQNVAPNAAVNIGSRIVAPAYTIGSYAAQLGLKGGEYLGEGVDELSTAAANPVRKMMGKEPLPYKSQADYDEEQKELMNDLRQTMGLKPDAQSGDISQMVPTPSNLLKWGTDAAGKPLYQPQTDTGKVVTDVGDATAAGVGSKMGLVQALRMGVGSEAFEKLAQKMGAPEAVQFLASLVGGGAAAEPRATIDGVKKVAGKVSGDWSTPDNPDATTIKGRMGQPAGDGTPPPSPHEAAGYDSAKDYLRGQAQPAYDYAEQNNANLTPDLTNDWLDNAKKNISKEDPRVTGSFGERPSSKLIDNIDVQFRDTPMTLNAAMDVVHRINDEISSGNKYYNKKTGDFNTDGKRLYAMKMDLMDRVTNATDTDITGGKAALDAFKVGQDNWARSFRAGEIEHAMNSANMMDNPDTALRLNLRRIVNKPALFNRYQPEEQNYLKLASQTGVMGEVLRAAGGRLVGQGLLAAGHLPAAIGNIIAAKGFRTLAHGLREGQAQTVVDQIVAGAKKFEPPPPPPPPEPLQLPPPKPDQFMGDPTGGVRQLSSQEAFARDAQRQNIQNMGRSPDVVQAGLQHPGAAPEDPQVTAARKGLADMAGMQVDQNGLVDKPQGGGNLYWGTDGVPRRLPPPQPGNEMIADPTGAVRPTTQTEDFQNQQARRQQSDIGLTPDVVRAQQMRNAPRPEPARPGPDLPYEQGKIGDQEAPALDKAARERADDVAAEEAGDKPFFSALTRAVQAMKQPKAPAAQWKKAIENTPGLRKEELEWSGVNDWLDKQPTRPITKQELSDFVKSREVQLDEVVRGKPTDENGEEKEPETRVHEDDVDMPSDGDFEQDTSGYADSEMDYYSDDGFHNAHDSNAKDPDAFAKARKYASEEEDPEMRFVEENEDYVDPRQQSLDLGSKDTRPTNKYKWNQAAIDEWAGDQAQSSAEENAPYEGTATVGDDRFYIRVSPNEGSWEISDDNGRHIDDGSFSGRFSTGAQKAREALWAHLRDNDMVHDGDSEDDNFTPTKYGQYTLGGGENYKEMLMTLPDSKGGVYKDGHFEEPNVLAHIRMKDRTGPNGEKLLHLEEIQSDWHQQGRKKGYRNKTQQEIAEMRDDTNAADRAYGDRKDEELEKISKLFDDDADKTSFGGFKLSEEPLPKVYSVFDADGNRATSREFEDIDNAKALADRYSSDENKHSVKEIPANKSDYDLWAIKDAKGDIVSRENTRDRAAYKLARIAADQHPEVKELKDKRDAAQEEYSASVNGVPNAPFKSTWSELAFKRMMRYAAEHDYDGISWTTGKQQVSRYASALRNHVDEINWEKTPDGVHIVGTRNGSEAVNTRQKESELSDAIGKAMADQIAASPDQKGVIKGDNITIDDTGMAGFYDKMLPQMANKFGKKFGTKHEMSKIKTGDADDYEAPTAPPDTSGWKVSNSGGDFATKTIQDADGHTMLDGVTFPAKMSDADVLKAGAKEYMNRKQKVGAPVHYMKMTPELKNSVMQGQPMFKRGDTPQGPTDNSRMLAQGLAGEPTKQFTANEQKLVDSVNAIRDKMFPQAQTRFMKSMRDTADNSEVHGAYYRDLSGKDIAPVIAASLKSPDAATTARHEGIHFLKRNGYFTPTEWDTLSATAKDAGWLDKHNIEGRYADMTPDERVEEAVAHEFGKGEATGWKGAPQAVQQIFRKVALFMRRIAASAREVMGKQATAQDILTNVETGKIGRRTFARGGPTRAQVKAGNYRKEHITIHGLPISIENKPGSIRRGHNWEVKMPCAYGYFKRTEGADGDHVDCFVGPHPKSDKAFVINQTNHHTGRFDEHKVMLGFASEKQARSYYEKAFSDGKGKDRIGSMKQMPVGHLKEWLHKGDTKRAV